MDISEFSVLIPVNRVSSAPPLSKFGSVGRRCTLPEYSSRASTVSHPCIQPSRFTSPARTRSRSAPLFVEPSGNACGPHFSFLHTRICVRGHASKQLPVRIGRAPIRTRPGPKRWRAPTNGQIFAALSVVHADTHDEQTATRFLPREENDDAKKTCKEHPYETTPFEGAHTGPIDR